MAYTSTDVAALRGQAVIDRNKDAIRLFLPMMNGLLSLCWFRWTSPTSIFTVTLELGDLHVIAQETGDHCKLTWRFYCTGDDLGRFWDEGCEVANLSLKDVLTLAAALPQILHVILELVPRLNELLEIFRD